ncbi:hypothetical protein [Streptomyces montanus]|uniref:hypothetical protein n=1 Tax=Streptomyces montanus TaxID=2580423 RepID=UPI001485C523|nr:hypothetical protein [Streptomyces montanus]
MRAPEYLAPLRTVPVDNVSDAANGGLRLGGAGKSKVRLFLKRGDTWTYVTAGTRVTAADGAGSARPYPNSAPGSNSVWTVPSRRWS